VNSEKRNIKSANKQSLLMSSNYQINHCYADWWR